MIVFRMYLHDSDATDSTKWTEELVIAQPYAKQIQINKFLAFARIYEMDLPKFVKTLPQSR